MSKHAHKTRTSLLDDRIGSLDGKAAGSSPAKEVFRTVSAILALFRGKIIANRVSVQLSDCCFDACEALEAAIEEGNTDDLRESTRVALEDLGRVTLEIHQTLKRGTSTPHIKYEQGKIEGYKTKIRDILDDLDRPCPSFNEDNSVRGSTTQQLDVHPGGGATSASEPGEAFGRLLRRKFVLHELTPLIEEILVYKDVVDMTRSLPKEDAQTFVDVVNEALDMPDLSPWAKNQCLRLLYKTCGTHALLPTEMKIPICYDRNNDALYSGGFADVWKGQHCGRDVAVKVIRTFSNSDFRKLIKRFCKEAITWKTLRHPNVLPLIGVTMTEVKFAMISDWMANGNLNEFVEANPDADRLKLLGDATRGLTYIHEWGVVHGDLKGANIVVDQSCRALLADFGMLTIISNPTSFSSTTSNAQGGGTVRWMSPERISPDSFGRKNSRPSKSSDCYSLGMVIYEVISGHLPFHEDIHVAVLKKVLDGDRPRREEGFADHLWNTLEQCWMPQPSDRPSVQDVLQCLEMCSDQVAEDMERNSGFDGLTAMLHKIEYHRPPFPFLTVRDILSPSDTANPHVGTPLVTNIQCTTSSPHQRAFSEALASRVMSQTNPSAENLGESVALSRHVYSGEVQDSTDLGIDKQNFLHPTETVSSIYRGQHRGSSSGSRDRGGVGPHSTPGSSRASPYPSPKASPPRITPAYSTSSFGLPPGGIGELGQQLDAVSYAEFGEVGPEFDPTLLPGGFDYEELGQGPYTGPVPYWLPPDEPSFPSQKPLSPPSLLIPDASPSMNPGDLRTKTPMINASQGDGGVMNGPQLHIVPATPILGGLPSTVPFIINPAETSAPPAWSTEDNHSIDGKPQTDSHYLSSPDIDMPFRQRSRSDSVTIPWSSRHRHSISEDEFSHRLLSHSEFIAQIRNSLCD